MTTHYARLLLPRLWHALGLPLLAGLMLLACPVRRECLAYPPASAQTLDRGSPAASADTPLSAILVADGWSIGRLFSGIGGRTRVVQVCVLTMCIALFILMRKLH